MMRLRTGDNETKRVIKKERRNERKWKEKARDAWLEKRRMERMEKLYVWWR